MKMCSICKTFKDEIEFSPRKDVKDGLSSRCKKCHNEEVRKLYRKNPESKLEEGRKRKQVLFDLTNEIKGKCGCNICKEKDVVCLDFHHLDPNKKDLSVSRLACLKSKNRMLKEIKKCVVVCANCHRKLHAGKVKLITDVMVA